MINDPIPLLGKNSVFCVLWFLYVKLSWRQGIEFFAALALLLVAIFSLFNFPALSVIACFIAIVTLVHAVYSFRQSYLNTRINGVELDTETVNLLRNLKPSLEEENSGFKLLHSPLLLQSEILYSKIFNSYLFSLENQSGPLVRIDVKHREFHLKSLPMRFDEISEKIKYQLGCSIRGGKGLFNEEKVGICSALYQGVEELCVFKTDYCSAFCTNDASCSIYSCKSDNNCSVLYQGLKTYPFVEESGINRILGFEDQVLFANNIGVNTIAFTLDNNQCCELERGQRLSRIGE